MIRYKDLMPNSKVLQLDLQKLKQLVPSKSHLEIYSQSLKVSSKVYKKV